MKLPECSVRRPVTTLMVFLGFLLLGLVCFTQLGIDLMPEIEPPAISVITAYPGASVEDVETKVTKVIEEEVSTVSNIDEVASKSIEGLSLVTCKFEWGTNLDEASNDIRDRLEFATRRLPDDVETPMVFKFNTSMWPILFYGAYAEESWTKLKDLLEDYVIEPLKAEPGVGAVITIGGLQRQINVHLRLEDMKARGITLEEVEGALQRENLTLPGGNIKVGSIDYAVRVPGEFQNVEEMRNIVIRQNEHATVYLRDIADVEDSFAELTRNVKVDGKNGLLFLVQKRSGANTVEVARRVKAHLGELKTRLPDDVKIVLLIDSSLYITDSIRNLSTTVLSAGVIVSVITFFFLGSATRSLIIVLTIPFSLVITFIILYVFGYTINWFSLVSMTIAAGMVVDSAIVILENIARYIDGGVNPVEASPIGASEVGLAVSASTLTTAIIFLPMVFVKGIVGIFFRQLGLCVAGMIGASLVASLTLTPMLCSQLLRRREGNQHSTVALFSRAFYALRGSYSRLLSLCLRHRGATIVGAIVLFLAVLSLLPSVGTEFFPEEDTGEVRVILELPVGARVERTTELTAEVADTIEKRFGKSIKHLFYRAGYERRSLSIAFGQKEASNTGIIHIRFVGVRRRDFHTSEASQIISELIKSRPDWLSQINRLTVTSADPMANAFFGVTAKPLTVEILGQNFEEMERVARGIRAVMESTPGVYEPVISRELAKPEISVSVDRLSASELKVRVATVADSVRTYIYGKQVSKYREHGDEYDIFLRLRGQDRSLIEDLRNLTVTALDGRQVRLDGIAEIEETLGPLEINRKQQQRLISVGARVFGRPLGDVANEIERKLKELNIPRWVTVQWGGFVKEQKSSFKWLSMALVLAIILVYMVMASQFESFIHPFVIMLSVPFALVGCVVALYLSGYPLAVMPFVGIIMVVGIVVNNAIVLVDYTNVLRARGLEIEDAVRQAGATRLRPVLMTALTTIGGMVPLALSTGEGSEAWRPLGATVIGGLLLSTLVTLVLVPVVYSIAESLRRSKT